MTTTKISATEAVNELKRVAKLYESLSNAVRAVDVLVNLEALEKELNASVSSLQKQVDSLLVQSKDSTDYIAEAKKKVMQSEKLAESIKAKAEIEATVIVNKAKQEAKIVIESALAKKAEADSYVESMRQLKSNAKNEAVLAESELNTLKAKIKDIKKHVASELGL